jgi:hypothetical protein
MTVFRDVVRQQLSFLFMLRGRSSITISSFTMRFMYLGVVQLDAVS